MMNRKLLVATVFMTTISIPLAGFCQRTMLVQSDGQITIPLDLSSQRPVVELMIEGKGPYRFIFDTGSSTNVIDEGLVAQSDWEVVGEDPLRTPGSDNELMSKRFLVPKISFTGTGISQDAVMNAIAIRKMLPIDGILCPNLFSDYLITIDYPKSELNLTKGELREGNKDVTKFVQNPRVINLNILVDSIQVEAHLDSGNPGGIALPFSLSDKLSFAKAPIEAGDIRTPVASFKSWTATLSGSINIGGVTFENPDVMLVEGFEFVNLGYQVFKDLAITLDKKNSLIRLAKSVSVADEKEIEVNTSESNEYTGTYGGNQRRVFLENGEMYIQRGNHPKLKLSKIGDGLYEMVFHMPVDNELPNVKFIRDGSNAITGFTFIFKDGREEVVMKDE